MILFSWLATELELWRGRHTDPYSLTERDALRLGLPEGRAVRRHRKRRRLRLLRGGVS